MLRAKSKIWSWSCVVIKQLIARLLFDPNSIESNVSEHGWKIWVAKSTVIRVCDTLAYKSPQKVAVSSFDHQWTAAVTIARGCQVCKTNNE